MAKYVPDAKTKRWVVIAPHRTDRPHSAKSSVDTVCPFCVGNEHETPPEVYRVGAGGANTPGWQVRVVPNKYTITDIHEVIIHSPDHTKNIEALPLEQVNRILLAYRDRYRAHEQDGQVLIFCNQGLRAGASLTHPHSQLVVVPNQITLDAVEREAFTNLVEDSGFFTTYCPDFSQWPYEVWIAPKEEGSLFGDINERQALGLAGILQRTLAGLKEIAATGAMPHQAGEDFVYNYYIYHGQSWFIRIIPRFIHRAGFELGTGLNVNSVDPVHAAEEVKKYLP